MSAITWLGNVVSDAFRTFAPMLLKILIGTGLFWGFVYAGKKAAKEHKHKLLGVVLLVFGLGWLAWMPNPFWGAVSLTLAMGLLLWEVAVFLLAAVATGARKLRERRRERKRRKEREQGGDA